MTLRKRSFETLWGKEEMLVTSIFSFPTMFSTPFTAKPHCSDNIIVVRCKCFQFWMTFKFFSFYSEHVVLKIVT